MIKAYQTMQKCPDSLQNQDIYLIPTTIYTVLMVSIMSSLQYSYQSNLFFIICFTVIMIVSLVLLSNQVLIWTKMIPVKMCFQLNNQIWCLQIAFCNAIGLAIFYLVVQSLISTQSSNKTVLILELISLILHFLMGIGIITIMVVQKNVRWDDSKLSTIEKQYIIIPSFIKSIFVILILVFSVIQQNDIVKYSLFKDSIQEKYIELNQRQYVEWKIQHESQEYVLCFSDISQQDIILMIYNNSSKDQKNKDLTNEKQLAAFDCASIQVHKEVKKNPDKFDFVKHDKIFKIESSPLGYLEKNILFQEFFSLLIILLATHQLLIYRKYPSNVANQIVEQYNIIEKIEEYQLQGNYPPLSSCIDMIIDISNQLINNKNNNEIKHPEQIVTDNTKFVLNQQQAQNNQLFPTGITAPELYNCENYDAEFNNKEVTYSVCMICIAYLTCDLEILTQQIEDHNQNTLLITYKETNHYKNLIQKFDRIRDIHAQNNHLQNFLELLRNMMEFQKEKRLNPQSVLREIKDKQLYIASNEHREIQVQCNRYWTKFEGKYYFRTTIDVCYMIFLIIMNIIITALSFWYDSNCIILLSWNFTSILYFYRLIRKIQIVNQKFTESQNDIDDQMTLWEKNQQK